MSTLLYEKGSVESEVVSAGTAAEAIETLGRIALDNVDEAMAILWKIDGSKAQAVKVCLNNLQGLENGIVALAQSIQRRMEAAEDAAINAGD